METSKVIGMNLKRIAYEHGKNQTDIAKALGLSKATISSWMSGTRTPRMENVDALCEYFNVRRSDIIEEQNNRSSSVSAIRIPVFGSVAAGIPLEMIEDVADFEEIPESMLKGGKVFFGLTIKGDSMSPRIMSGDVVIVQSQDICESGDIAIVAINGAEAVCKKVVFSESFDSHRLHFFRESA